MQYTNLGNAELNISRICLGCMGFGDASKGQHSWTIDEARSREIIKRALELGVNFFDTAIAYRARLQKFQKVHVFPHYTLPLLYKNSALLGF